MGLQKYFNFSKKKASSGNSDEENRKWQERIRDIYKLTVRNSETLEEVSSFNLTLLNLYILLSTIFVLTALLVALLFIYTPILHYLPGTEKVVSQREVANLTKQVKELEKALSAEATYNDAVKKRIFGEHEFIDNSEDTLQKFTPAQLNVKKNDAEIKLVAEVEKGLFLENNNKSPKDDNLSSIKEMNFTSPVIGETSAGFNPSTQHFGIDIIAPKGTPIKSIANGVVVFSDWTMETGNTIVVKHSNDLISVYKHNSKLLKKTGERVKPGEAIAIIGNTGKQTSGPHLHFELWYRQKSLNPKKYVRFE